MTPIIFHQTQTREQKFAQLALEVIKAGSLAAFFTKLSASARHGASAAHPAVESCQMEQRMHPRR